MQLMTKPLKVVKKVEIKAPADKVLGVCN